MPEHLGAVVFEACSWRKTETAADAVAEVLAVYQRKHGQPATALFCSSNDLAAVQAAADACGMAPDTQGRDTVVWTRTAVAPRTVWAGRV